MTPEQARTFALLAHGDQRYGDRPYSYHLDAVVAHLAGFGDDAKIIGYLHDVVEDTDTTHADIQLAFGDFIARCVAIVTDEAGNNRKQRKARSYAKMAGVTGEESVALVVKVADRLANIQSCVADDNRRLLAMYQNEHEVFTRSVYRPGLCEALWEQLYRLIQS